MKKKTLKLIKDDPWLSNHKDEVNSRFERYNTKLNEIKEVFGSLKKFASAYEFMGITYDKNSKGWWYREWAPEAETLSLIGDFNQWNPEMHPLLKTNEGVWEVFIADNSNISIEHLSKFKVRVKSSQGTIDRLPAYSTYVVQDAETHDFSACLWNPPTKFNWSDKSFKAESQHTEPYIYECHVGMAQEEEKVGSYEEFRTKLLPRIKDQGYNTVQLMAIQEHPYYGSFGYHVSNFFAPSSRFGTPEDLKRLINTAHEMGIAVIMDIVHSHAVKNIAEGLSEFDGSDDQYFHPGGKGYHSGWDSKLFNYGKEEVLQFLLSNVRYWLEEFHFDGFRYDGVTSMLYTHHGDHVTFDNYDKYFNDVDWDVLIYLQLANKLAKELKPHSIVIAEDMSGMPGLCRKIPEGGIGFDFRLAMGIPDFWIKLLKHKSDDEWNVHELWGTLSNRREHERTIAYSESHDQALVGDKSIAFWLMEKEMYFHMQVSDENLTIDRGLALHKMIRLLTISTGGEGWLNFIGNEFGHPEWVDFPREGNNWSYQYARRQWSLADDENLKYKYLNRFGKSMVVTAKENQIVQAEKAKELNLDQTNHTLIYQRNELIFALNFSPTNSVPDYRFWVPQKGHYEIVLNSDDKEFGGFGRVEKNTTYSTVKIGQDNFLSIYLPNRTGLVFKKKGSKKK